MSVKFFITYRERANLKCLGYSDELIDSLKVQLALKLSDNNVRCPIRIPPEWYCPFRSGRAEIGDDSGWTFVVSKKRSARGVAGAPADSAALPSPLLPQLTLGEKIRQGVKSRLDRAELYSSLDSDFPYDITEAKYESSLQNPNLDPLNREPMMDELKRIRKRSAMFELLTRVALHQNEVILPINGQGFCFWDSLAEAVQAQTGYRGGSTGQIIQIGVIGILRQSANLALGQHCMHLGDHLAAHPRDYGAMDILMIHAAAIFLRQKLEVRLLYKDYKALISGQDIEGVTLIKISPVGTDEESSAYSLVFAPSVSARLLCVREDVLDELPSTIAIAHSTEPSFHFDAIVVVPEMSCPKSATKVGGTAAKGCDDDGTTGGKSSDSSSSSSSDNGSNTGRGQGLRGRGGEKAPRRNFAKGDKGGFRKERHETAPRGLGVRESLPPTGTQFVQLGHNPLSEPIPPHQKRSDASPVGCSFSLGGSQRAGEVGGDNCEGGKTSVTSPSLEFKPRRRSEKERLQQKCHDLELPDNGSVKDLKTRLKDHSDSQDDILPASLLPQPSPTPLRQVNPTPGEGWAQHRHGGNFGGCRDGCEPTAEHDVGYKPRVRRATSEGSMAVDDIVEDEDSKSKSSKPDPTVRKQADTPRWRKFTLKDYSGGKVALNGAGGTELGFTILPLDDDQREYKLTVAAMTACVTTVLETCLPIIAAQAPRLARGALTLVQQSSNLLMSKVLPRLLCVLGLGRRRGLCDGDVIQGLAITVNGTTFVYEPQNTFGLFQELEVDLSEKSRSSLFLPLCNPNVGRSLELDRADDLKELPKTQKLVDSASDLVDSLMGLPSDFSFVLIITAGDSSLWQKKYDYQHNGGGGNLYFSRGDYYESLCERLPVILRARVSSTSSESYLLRCLLGVPHETDLSPLKFLYGLGPDVLDLVFSLFRGHLHNVESNKRAQGIGRPQIQKLASAVVQSLFHEPPERARNSHSSDEHDSRKSSSVEQSFDCSGEQAGNEGSFRFVPSNLCVKESGLGVEVGGKFEHFSRTATKSAVCVTHVSWRDVSGDGNLRASISLPSYTQDSLEPSKGPPVLVQVIGDSDGSVTFVCPCDLHRLATFATSTSVRGAENHMCWHERVLRQEALLESILAQREPTSETAATTFEVLLTRPPGLYLYAFVSLAHDGSLLGNLKDAIVTVTKGRMRCGKCHGGRRFETKEKGRACLHIKHIVSAIAEGNTDERVILGQMFGVSDEVEETSSPAFNVETGEFEFSSLSSSIAATSMLPIPAVESINAFSPSPVSRMGGRNDVDHLRVKALLDFVQNKDDPLGALLRQGLATRTCGGCMSSLESRSMDGDVDIQGGLRCCKCKSAPFEFECPTCPLALCNTCCEVAWDAKISAVFEPMDLYGAPAKNFIDARVALMVLERMLKYETEDDPHMHRLQPMLPSPGTISPAGCLFEKGDMVFAHNSVVFYPTHKRQVAVCNLKCDNGCCTVEPTGAELRLHRQTRETIIHLDLIHLFHFSTRNTRGSTFKGFVGFCQELYRANGSGSFMDSDTFAKCYYGAKCRELQGKSLGRPCFTCPKVFVHGVWATQCTVIAVDAKMDIKIARRLLRTRRSGAPDTVTPDAPLLDCRKRSHLDRLFFPGDIKSANHKYRNLISAVSKYIIYKSSVVEKKLSKDERSIMRALEAVLGQFESDADLAPIYVSAFRMIYDCYVIPELHRTPSNLVLQLARWFLAITNTQCSMDQFLPPRACDFIDECLELSHTGNLSIKVAECAERSGVRRRLVQLVQESFQSIPGAPKGHIEMLPAVHDMLAGMCATARRDFKKSEAQAPAPDLPTPLPADYSSGVAMFVTKGGVKFRLFPRFKNCGKSGRSGERTCTKPSWAEQECKKWQWSSDGNVTFMCAKSGCVLGTFFLDAAEGRSSATAGIYCYFPNWGEIDMTVVCDTPCMHSIYTANRLPYHFRHYQWACDRFHLPPHTCKLIFNPDEFAYLDRLNLSLIEQWHAIVDGLSVSLQRMNLDHAMFILLLLQYDRYDELAKRANATTKDQCWPDDPDVVDLPVSDVNFSADSTDAPGVSQCDDGRSDHSSDSEGDDFIAHSTALLDSDVSDEGE